MLFSFRGIEDLLGDDVLIGTMAGLEFIGFALVVYRVYRVGPNIKRL
jgi:hypothetical protein